MVEEHLKTNDGNKTMTVDQYYAWDANGNKVTADSPWSLRFECRTTPVYREREVYERGRWVLEVSKARD